MTTNHTEEAQNLLDTRAAHPAYGDRIENMERVAQVFSGILGTEVRPEQVTLLMIGYKAVRASKTPDYEDNVKDIEGYALMFREIIGDDMISAAHTDEYLLEKSRREMEGPSVSAFYCQGCDRTLPVGAGPDDHEVYCKTAELNRHVRAYNGRYTDELPQPTAEQAVRMQKEVPSYQPGSNMSPQHLMGVYREQLMNMFQRAWKDRGPTVPVEKFAEIAAREAVEYFWLTFQRNAQFEAGVREHKSL